MHLNHHKYTNTKDKDPDYWVVHQAKLPIPIKTWFQSINYGIFYWKHYTCCRPIVEVVEFYLQVFLYISAPLILYKMGLLREGLQYWILPAQLALERIAYLFDILPHELSHSTPQENPFQTTSAIKLSRKTLKKPKKDNPLWFSFIMQVNMIVNEKKILTEHIST